MISCAETYFQERKAAIIRDADKGIKAMKRAGDVLNQTLERAKKAERNVTGFEALDIYNCCGIPVRELIIILWSHGLSLDVNEFADMLDEQNRSYTKLKQCGVVE